MLLVKKPTVWMLLLFLASMPVASQLIGQDEVPIRGGIAGLPGDNSAVVVLEFDEGHRITQRDLQRVRAETIEELKKAKNQQQRQHQLRNMQEILTEYFQQELASRDDAITKIELRSKSLRQQLEKRRQAKGDIIDLQIKLLQHEADGLGYFGSEPSDDSDPTAGGGNAQNPAKALDEFQVINLGNNIVADTKFTFLVGLADLPWTPARLKSAMNDWRNSLKKARNTAELEAARSTVRDGMNAYFDADIRQRESAIAKIERRAEQLRLQLQKRKEAKDEIITLQLKVIENEAAGLGFSPDAIAPTKTAGVGASGVPIGLPGPAHMPSRFYGYPIPHVNKNFPSPDQASAWTRDGWAERIKKELPKGSSRESILSWITNELPKQRPREVATGELDQVRDVSVVHIAGLNPESIKITIRIDLPSEHMRDGTSNGLSAYFFLDDHDKLLGTYVLSSRQIVLLEQALPKN